ncbi:MAG TPA: hypothetical protein VFD19_00890, partial [Clostridia bacterium]|nr:hypothetical protein [Clostridia bacterium]
MKSFLDYKNPALWITATVAAACIVPAVLVLKNPKRKAKNIFDWQYSVADVLYQASFYSSTCTPDTAPLYHFSGDRQLFVKDSAMDQDDGAEWQLLGRMEAITLSKTNFDDLFFTGPD